jgi:hypothetical protein
MLYGDETTFSAAALDRFADAGVRVFLAADGVSRSPQGIDPSRDLGLVHPMARGASSGQEIVPMLESTPFVSRRRSVPQSERSL